MFPKWLLQYKGIFHSKDSSQSQMRWYKKIKFIFYFQKNNFNTTLFNPKTCFSADHGDDDGGRSLCTYFCQVSLGMLRSLGVVLLFELFESRALAVPTYCQQFFELSCCWCLWAISRNIFASNAPPNCQLSEKVASSSRNVRTGDPQKIVGCLLLSLAW